jgi:TonB family protein
VAVVRSARAEDVTPPVARSHVDAQYPASALADRKHAQVVVLVTVDATGHVASVEIAESGGKALDESAMAAMRQWTFEPAKRGGRPVPARIKVPFHFAPPAQAPDIVPHHEAAVAGGVAAPPRPSPPSADGYEDVRVEGAARPASRGASDVRIEGPILRAAPHATSADLLATAPGVYVAHPEGESVAQRVYLRGFDADHGQDVEFRVSGIPMNQASHVHGQGYADLNLVMPEVVRSLRVIEGVYDPRQGDFAVAGTAEMDLGVVERGFMLRYGRGSFGTDRVVGVIAPRGLSEETFGAAAVRSTDGFGPGVRGATSGGGIAQYRLHTSATSSVLLHVAGYGSRSSVAGVVRRDDIDAGRVGFLDAYADPAARSQAAATSRAQIGLSVEKRGDEGARATAAVWLATSGYRSALDFTGYTQRSRVEPSWVGRGDLVEQTNQDLSLGGGASYRSPKVDPLDFVSAQLELGTELKTAAIEQTQNLLRAPQNEVWDERVRAKIRATDVGLFADGLVAGAKYVRLRAGARGDALFYDVDDALGNFAPSFSRKTHLPGFRRTAGGVAWGPRATLEGEPLRWLRANVSYGEGFRSPAARQLEEGEQAPFAKVRSHEVGLTARLPGELGSLSLVAYQTNLSYDLAFDAKEGRLERIGPTTRRGLVGHVVGRPRPWLNAALSATFVDATLDAPPTPTPSNPSPAYREGQSLPYVPPLVVRQDVSASGEIASLWGQPVIGTLGYGTTFLSERPLPYGQRSPPVFLLDARAAVRRQFLEISLDAINVLDLRYADTEYAFPSNWNTSQAPSLLPARHVAAGSPRTLMLSGTLFL